MYQANRLNKQRDIEMFSVVMIISALITVSFDFIPYEYSVYKTLICEAVIFVILMIPSAVAYKLQGKKISVVTSEISYGYKQFVIIIPLVAIKIIMLLICNITGYSAIGMNRYWSFPKLVIFFIYYIFFNALSEEFIFRIYVQESLIDWLGKFKILAPLISAIIFALMHGINGYVEKVITAFIMALIWGYTRYFNKNCSFWTLVITHGLSNYITYVAAIVNYQINGTAYMDMLPK